MYGALQGKNKSETAAKYGEDQVKVSLFKTKKKKNILGFYRFGDVLMIFPHRNLKNQVNIIHEMIQNIKYFNQTNKKLNLNLIFLFSEIRSTCFTIN
jgi:hypothetical protein